MIVKDIGYSPNIFFELNKFSELNGASAFMKMEGLNFSGSIKIKPAFYMIQQMEHEGLIDPSQNSIIESSSGNLAKALSQICHSKGYRFKAIIDVNTPIEVIRWLKLFGSEMILVDEPDINGGYLGSRIKIIKEIIAADPSCIWINQYSNINNIDSHYLTTAKEILEDFPTPDYIFIGTGTTGTLGGIIKLFDECQLKTKIIAVDAAGSVTFSKVAKKRFIPGIGTSLMPELAKLIDMQKVYDVIWVNETDAIKTCHRLLQDYSIPFGGSTGSVVAAMLSYADKFKSSDTIICISPDFGSKYLDTVYNAEWVKNKYGFLIE